jgi:nicotinate-nucleotide adenylyltransferase
MAHLATEDFPKLKPLIEFKLSQPNYGKYLGSPRREIPQSWIFVDYGKRQLNILIQVENFEVILQNHAIYVYPRIEAKDRTAGSTFIRVESSFKITQKYI